MSATDTTSHNPPSSRKNLRLRMVNDDSHPVLDGGWWPRSRDPVREIKDLVWKFPAEYGRISRALFSPPDWERAPRMVDLGTRYLRVGSYPSDDTHLIVLQTLSRRRLTLLVIPPDCSAAQGEAALAAASAPGNREAGSQVLASLGISDPGRTTIAGGVDSASGDDRGA